MICWSLACRRSASNIRSMRSPRCQLFLPLSALQQLLSPGYGRAGGLAHGRARIERGLSDQGGDLLDQLHGRRVRVAGRSHDPSLARLSRPAV